MDSKNKHRRLLLLRQDVTEKIMFGMFFIHSLTNLVKKLDDNNKLANVDFVPQPVLYESK